MNSKPGTRGIVNARMIPILVFSNDGSQGIRSEDSKEYLRATKRKEEPNGELSGKVLSAETSFATPPFFPFPGS